MPITRFLAGRAFDPETIKTMSDMLEGTCGEIGVNWVTERTHPRRSSSTRNVALYLATMADSEACRT